MGAEFHTTLCAPYSFNIEYIIVKVKETFSGEGKE